MGDKKTATLTTALRLLLITVPGAVDAHGLGGGSAGWLIPLFVALSVIVGLALGWRSRGKGVGEVEYGTWIALSVLLSPYGWTFDLTLLLIPLLVAFLRLSARWVFLFFVVAELLLLGGSELFCRTQDDFFFLPLLLCLLWGVAVTRGFRGQGDGVGWGNSFPLEKR